MTSYEAQVELHKATMRYRGKVVQASAMLTIFLVWFTGSLYGLAGLGLLALMLVGPKTKKPKKAREEKHTIMSGILGM